MTSEQHKCTHEHLTFEEEWVGYWTLTVACANVKCLQEFRYDDLKFGYKIVKVEQQK